MADVDVFRSYTQALRHPVIIGRIAGWRLPWALSATQLGAIAATTWILLVTRPLWARLGGVANLIVFSAVLVVVGWGVRHWRVEGRSPLRVAAAAITVTPGRRHGIRNGRPAVNNRPARSSGTAITILHRPVVRSHGRDDG